MALPVKLQNDIRQFQRLQQELGAVQQQRLQVDLKLREVTHTLEELKTLPEDAVVYRPIGGLLVRAKNRKEVEDLLTEEKETAEVRLKAVERQEGHLKERYTSMQQDLTQALQAAGVATESSSEPEGLGPDPETLRTDDGSETSFSSALPRVGIVRLRSTHRSAVRVSSSIRCSE